VSGREGSNLRQPHQPPQRLGIGHVQIAAGRQAQLRTARLHRIHQGRINQIQTAAVDEGHLQVDAVCPANAPKRAQTGLARRFSSWAAC
jgi:hypothetical protein